MGPAPTAEACIGRGIMTPGIGCAAPLSAVTTCSRSMSNIVGSLYDLWEHSIDHPVCGPKDRYIPGLDGGDLTLLGPPYDPPHARFTAVTEANRFITQTHARTSAVSV
jgi:hypothetical protein